MGPKRTSRHSAGAGHPGPAGQEPWQVELRQAIETYRSLFDHAAIGIYRVTPKRELVAVNPALARMLGYGSPEEVIRAVRLGRQLYADPSQVLAFWDLMERSGVVSDFDLEYVRQDGSPAWGRVSAWAVPGEQGKVLYYEGMVEDFTERRLADEALRESRLEGERERAQLKVLSRRLVETQESERRMLARQLHDEVGQLLTGLQLLLEGGGGPDRETEMMALVRELQQRARTISTSLRPPMLDELGLLPTLQWHFEHYATQTGVQVRLTHEGLEGRRFPGGVELAAFRIVQEALTNVARHAHVQTVAVRVTARQERLRLEVEDRGPGFDVAHALGLSSGLLGMRERAQLLGGRFAVESTPGAGTRVSADLPLAPAGAGRQEP